MRSRAELRQILEMALRATLLATLAFALWRAVRAESVGAHPQAASMQTLRSGITRVLSMRESTVLHVDMESSPSRSDRDLLVALRRGGIPVHWRGDIPPVALEVVRSREPAGGGRITVVSGDATPLALTDSAGPLERVRADAGVSIEAATLVGSVGAAHGAFVARAPVPDPPLPRAVLVLGRAGWEAKFVMAALTESGWTVRASIPAAPGVIVRDAGIAPIDTARYDAVIALDSSALDLAPALARFVAQGGGLIAIGSALSLDALGAIAPALPTVRRPGRILLAEDTVTPRDLPVRPLASLRQDAVPLARENAGVTLAARRAGLGRVLAVGYDEIWRWRLLGGASGVSEHRAWWSRAVASVAPERTAGRGDYADAAPRAATYDAVGEPSPVDVNATGNATDTLPLLLLSVVVVVLLAEIASRRFRGAR